MNRHTSKLSDEDRRAVDLVLGHGSAAAHHGMSAASAAVSQRRLAAVQRVLDTIGAMPEMAPPADLVAKTMKRIDRAAGTKAATATHHKPAHMPHA